MEKSALIRQECIARTDNCHRFGIDAEGRTYYQDALLGAVWLPSAEEIVHIQAEVDLRSWARFVCEEIGWKRLAYSEESTAGWLSHIIEGAV